MIAMAFPAFLAAGVVLASVALGLHFLARRPPQRHPLPTARFLQRDPRTLLRAQRVPTDVPLLLTRMLFAVALGAAFAGVTWSGRAAGPAQVVLVHGGASSVPWPDVITEVRSTLGEVDAGPVERTAIVVYGLEEGHRVTDVDALDRIQRGTNPATADAGLRALREVVSQNGWDETRLTWVLDPSWDAWTPDISILREPLWPGSAQLRFVGSEASSADGPRTAWIQEGLVGGPLDRALGALSYRVVSGAGDAGSNPRVVFAENVSAGSLQPLLDRAEEGVTVVLWGLLPPDADSALPWDRAGPAPGSVLDSSTSQGIVLPDGRVLDLDLRPEVGSPAEGARVVAVLENGMPIAAASPRGSGCVLYLSGSLIASGVTADPEYPLLVGALADGCHWTANGHGLLDTGARTILASSELPERVGRADLPRAGTLLTPWLLLLALGLFCAELVMTRETA